MEQVIITLPNHKVSIRTLWYQYRLIDLLHITNNNLLILTEAI